MRKQKYCLDQNWHIFKVGWIKFLTFKGVLSLLNCSSVYSSSLTVMLKWWLYWFLKRHFNQETLCRLCTLIKWCCPPHSSLLCLLSAADFCSFLNLWHFGTSLTAFSLPIPGPLECLAAFCNFSELCEWQQGTSWVFFTCVEHRKSLLTWLPHTVQIQESSQEQPDTLVTPYCFCTSRNVILPTMPLLRNHPKGK